MCEKEGVPIAVKGGVWPEKLNVGGVLGEFMLAAPPQTIVLGGGHGDAMRTHGSRR